MSQMLDMSLLKDPVFMLIGVSNFFGMAGLYVPFVYLVDCAQLDVSNVFFFIDNTVMLIKHYFRVLIQIALVFFCR